MYVSSSLLPLLNISNVLFLSSSTFYTIHCTLKVHQTTLITSHSLSTPIILFSFRLSYPLPSIRVSIPIILAYKPTSFCFTLEKKEKCDQIIPLSLCLLSIFLSFTSPDLFVDTTPLLAKTFPLRAQPFSLSRPTL